ncbi:MULTISPECIES: ABC transporter ATP-binding protein [unclassified Leucobacter]|uniref:ABC transporter ATP-binding protein n=1 Tax=unclassified Leucobacter TaxID=2621730 RepID=UPI00165D39D3|nr:MULTISPECIES: ABC transporter ATP-binding protein [unclassified Leucobacter]MBC9927128.1 ABC transporter ATP-binding protein [Leucobacter sp. cx-169]MBC9936409.1 ABC transporter ATP-binding protein [Leucobacter sp. cx-87]
MSESTLHTPAAESQASAGGEKKVLLQVSDLAVAFGGIKAVDGLSFSVREGEIVSVIGPNGAGKTSAFNCISGFYRPNSGSVTFDGEPMTRKKPSYITKKGMARTFQNVRLFSDMSVLENVKTGMHATLGQNIFDAMLQSPRYRRSEEQCTRDAQGWLDFVGFRADDELLVTQLPYGEQRRVEIARALATQPRLLLLDEPGAGLNHNEKAELIDLIRKIRDLGVSIVLIEHDMGLVMQISERIVVLNYGKEIADGTPEQIKNDPVVIAAYLGEED